MKGTGARLKCKDEDAKNYEMKGKGNRYDNVDLLPARDTSSDTFLSQDQHVANPPSYIMLQNVPQHV